jgi:hypothetical protein
MKETDVSRTISVFIIRDVMCIDMYSYEVHGSFREGSHRDPAISQQFQQRRSFLAKSNQPTNQPGAGGRRYSSYPFMTSALDGEWSASRPGRALPPGKGPPVPIVQEAMWAPEPVWTQRLGEKSSCLCRRSNLDRPVLQSVVTDIALTELPQLPVLG